MEPSRQGEGERLERYPLGVLCGYIVGDHVARADLEGIQAELPRRQIDQPLGHRAGDRVADGAVLAHLHLVLGDHFEVGPVVAEPVGRPDQAHHLVALHGAGARIGRERADAGHVVHLDRPHPPVVLEGEAGAHPVVAGVDVAGEGLHAVGGEFHRPLEQQARAHHRHVLVVEMQLHPEGAADIRGDHPDPGLRSPKCRA